MLNNLKTIYHRQRLLIRGDTIVEVLIAIAVASFAIGTSYAIANKSLQAAITSRERNEAVNIIQSQIAALKIRYAGTDSEKHEFFYSDDGFVYRPSVTPIPASSSDLPKTDFHFCLDPASKKSTEASWKRIENHFTSPNGPENISSSNTYTAGCIKTLSDTQFFIDIEAQVTETSRHATNPTVYKFNVRWSPIGSAPTATSTVYYRL